MYSFKRMYVSESKTLYLHTLHYLAVFEGYLLDNCAQAVLENRKHSFPRRKNSNYCRNIRAIELKYKVKS